MKSALRRSIAALVAVSLLASALPAGALERDASLDATRQRVATLLVEHGVDAREAHERAAALTDEEASRVAAEFDKLPAGGNPAAAIAAIGYAFIFVIAVGVTAIASLIGAIAREARKQKSTGHAQTTS